MNIDLERFTKEELLSMVNDGLDHAKKQRLEIERLHSIIKEVREIFKDYGEKEDIVGYTMYNITGEMLLNLFEILDKEDI